MAKHALVFLAVFSGLLLSVNSVYAPWSTLGTGYAITSNYHGIDVPFGTEVTVTAYTLDSRVTQVTFRWHRPDDAVVREVSIPVFTDSATGKWNNGTSALIRRAADQYTPDVMGDWGVQAFFIGTAGGVEAGLGDVVKIRATSFNLIPEAPLGTVTLILSMFGALGVLAIKKKAIRRG